MNVISLRDAAAFLKERLAVEVDQVEVLTGGGWSQAFAFRHGERDLVVRFSEHVDDFEKDRAAHQFSCMEMPVPAVLEIGEGRGCHFCISERIFGEMIDDLDAGRMAEMVPAVMRLLDALRRADFGKWIEAIGAPSYGWREQLLSADEENERIFGWHDRMASSATGDWPYRHALAYLRDRVADLPDGNHLTHNDLLHHNVFVQADAIAGVIDWGCAGRGDFLYELALFTFYGPWYPAMRDIDWRSEALRHYREISLAVPGFEERLRCYEVHLALSGMAYAAFKENWGSLEEHARVTMRILGR